MATLERTGARAPEQTRHTPPGATATPSRIWGVTRIALGLTFLWAFLDKAFALGFATGRLEDGTIDVLGDAAWVNGGSPTEGFLSFGTSGPLAGFYQGFAGATWADWLFMVGLLGIGIALTFGIAMRAAAFSGALLLMLMWSATLLPANNPVLDDHVIEALVLVGLWRVRADTVLGLGERWRDLGLVRRTPVLQ